MRAFWLSIVNVAAFNFEDHCPLDEKICMRCAHNSIHGFIRRGLFHYLKSVKYLCNQTLSNMTQIFIVDVLFMNGTHS